MRNARALQNSAQAIQWALKKKEMLQRAKGLQQQHRYGIRPPSSKKSVGEYSKPAEASKQQVQKYEESKIEEMDPEEELRRARASLKLLKRKMSGKKHQSATLETTLFNRAQTCEVGAERGPEKENKGESGGSSFYRKAFKPRLEKPHKTAYGFALGMREEDRNLRRKEIPSSSEMSPGDQEQEVQLTVSMSRFSSYAEKPKKQKKVEMEEEPEEMEMKECEECGRKFNQQAYEKHHKICRKVFQQKRKKFDITKRRKAEGAFEEVRGRKGKKEEKRKSNKWKQQSEQLRAAMRSIRGNNLGSSTDTFGTGAYAPLNDLTECDFCGRSFNDAAIERHRPICERNYKMKQIQTRNQAKKKGNSRF